MKMIRYFLEVTFFFVYFTEADPVYIEEIGLYMPQSLVVVCMGSLIIMWNMLFSVREACREKALYETAFLLFPIELFMLLIFAQHHVVIAGMILILLAACPFFITNQVRMAGIERQLYEEDNPDVDIYEIGERERKTICQRVILAGCLILAVPSILAMTVYDQKLPYDMGQREERAVIESGSIDRNGLADFL